MMEAKQRRPSMDRRFYSWAALVGFLLVLVGFAKTYYLKGLFDGPALSGLVHAHGLIMTSWWVLFIVQVRLVAAGRTDLHRKLGIAGALLAALVIVVGFMTALVAASHGVTPGPPPLVFLVVPIGDIVVFTCVVAAGLGLRRRVQAHRRLMLLASLSILPAAIARIPLEILANAGLLAFFGLADLLIVACVVFDTIRHRRLHPAFAWGALFIIASHPLRFLLAGTASWMSFATWLVSFVPKP